MERKGLVSFKGSPITLTGSEIKPGDTAPDFTVVGKDMNPVKLSDFKGQIVIISAVPSLDTPVCELQTIRFNEEASKLNAKLMTISMDLPFAQARFCQAHALDKAVTASDYKDREFAQKYGLYMLELGLIARSVIIVGKTGAIEYIQIVKEMSKQPDYDDVLKEAKRLGA